MTLATESIPLSIFDTTLRDGEQAPGNAMTVSQKVRIAHELEELGVDVIEAGFPAASEQDFAAVRALVSELSRVKICVFSRANRSDLETARRAVEGTPRNQVEILGSASDIHLRFKRNIDRERALDEVYEAVGYARKLGFEDICVAPEDATRADLTFLREMCEVCVSAGATMIGIPDTVGRARPAEITQLVKNVRAWVPPAVRVAIHTHNDLGMAVANTLAAIEAGVDEIQTTLCGVGERSGNCAVEEVAAALVVHVDHYRRTTNLNYAGLYSACQALIETLNLPMSRAKAVIGENAFATAAGLHQSGIVRNPSTYELVEPSTFGAQRRMAISRHSGRAAVAAKLEALGLQSDAGVVERIYEQLIRHGEPLCSDDRLRKLAEECYA